MGVESCVVRGVFPSPDEYRHANVNDGANVRCRSEVPVIIGFGQGCRDIPIASRCGW